MTLEVDVDSLSGDFRLQARFSAQGIAFLKGENGAGKTFLLKTIAGLAASNEGTVKVNGIDVSMSPPWKRSIVYVSQNSYFRHMTVGKHLMVSMADRNGESTYVNALCKQLSIDRNRKISDLSQGQRMRVSIATAILSGNQVILLDEVLSNVSGIQEVIPILYDNSRERNVDILIVSHGIDSGKSKVLNISNGVLLQEQ